MSIRATLGRPQPTRRPSMASSCRSSTTPKQSAASSCCQEDGSSSEASPGPLVSADSPETTNDSATPSPGTTTWPSLGSCSPSSQKYSTKVHNGLQIIVIFESSRHSLFKAIAAPGDALVYFL